MSTFVLELQDALHHEQVDAVESFVGRDARDSFGVQASQALESRAWQPETDAERRRLRRWTRRC